MGEYPKNFINRNKPESKGYILYDPIYMVAFMGNEKKERQRNNRPVLQVVDLVKDSLWGVMRRRTKQDLGVTVMLYFGVWELVAEDV